MNQLKLQYSKILEYKLKIYELSWMLAPYVWILLSKIKIKPYNFKNSSLKSRDQFHILVSDNYLISPYEVKGADLTKSAISWIEDLNKNQVTKIVTLYDAKLEKSNSIFLTYDWILSFIEGKNIFQLIYISARLSHQLNKNYDNFWLALPDSYYLKVNILAKILEICSSNLSIFILQNTRDEMLNYGFMNIVSPVFWTWPQNRRKQWETKTKWHSKDRKILIAASGGCRTREMLGDKYIEIFSRENFKIIKTNFSLTWEDYMEEVKSAQYIFTTCFLQDAYLTNSHDYNSRLSKFTITGRVWEALNVGAVLLTNNNKILNEMGFYPNIHFIDIDNVDNANTNHFKDTILFNNDKLSLIASNGKKRLEDLMNRRIL